MVFLKVLLRACAAREVKAVLGHVFPRDQGHVQQLLVARHFVKLQQPDQIRQHLVRFGIGGLQHRSGLRQRADNPRAVGLVVGFKNVVTKCEVTNVARGAVPPSVSAPSTVYPRPTLARLVQVLPKWRPGRPRR